MKEGLALVAVAVAAALISVATIRMRLRFADRGLAQPGRRSLHASPTPHGGGLGIVVAALSCGAWAGVGAEWLVPFTVLAVVSWADDWIDLPFGLRLAIHLGAGASVVLLHGIDVIPAVVLLAILIAWSTNAYNFMDGADGLAGSMATVGFAAYAVGFAAAGNAAPAALSAAVAGAAAGFLLFNWHPARIFMGDVGSIPTGFLAGGLGWYGYASGAWPAWFAPMVFSPFLLDATVTLALRLTRGERVWQAHRDHYYQRMVRGGYAHDAMCLRWAAVMLAGALLAELMLFLGWAGWFGAVAWAMFLIGLGRRIDLRWNRLLETESAK